MSVEVSRKHIKNIQVKTQASGYQITVGHFLWMARELQQAVEQGLPENEQVHVDRQSGVSGVTLRCSASISTELE